MTADTQKVHNASGSSICAAAKKYLLCCLMRDCDVFPLAKWYKVSASAAAAGRLLLSSAITGEQLRCLTYHIMKGAGHESHNLCN